MVVAAMVEATETAGAVNAPVRLFLLLTPLAQAGREQIDEAGRPRRAIRLRQQLRRDDHRHQRDGCGDHGKNQRGARWSILLLCPLH